MIIGEHELIVLDIMFLHDSLIMKEIGPDMLLDPVLSEQLLNDPIDNIGVLSKLRKLQDLLEKRLIPLGHQYQQCYKNPPILIDLVLQQLQAQSQLAPINTILGQFREQLVVGAQLLFHGFVLFEYGLVDEGVAGFGGGLLAALTLDFAF